MDTIAIVILAILAVVIVVLAFRYRDRIKVRLKGPLGTRLDFEGQNPATEAGRSGTAVSTNSTAAEATRLTRASGGGVAIGGDANKAKIGTHVHPPER